MVDPAEQARRDAFEEVRASLALEGILFDTAACAELEPYLRGELNADELIARLRHRYAGAAYSLD